MNDTAIERIKKQVLERVNQATNFLPSNEKEVNDLIGSIRAQVILGIAKMKDSGVFTTDEQGEVFNYCDGLLCNRKRDMLADLRRREREGFQFFA